MRRSANLRGSRRHVPIVTASVVIAIALVSGTASAAEPQALAKARALYNAADYDGAIAAATQARTQPGAADAAALVEARSHLERYRRAPDSADLAAAREALSAIRPSVLSPRDQVDFLVGLGQSLYLGELFGAAAELFDTAIDRGVLLAARDRLMLVDWWATALDREAHPGQRARELLARGRGARRRRSRRGMGRGGRRLGACDARSRLVFGAAIRYRPSRHHRAHPRARPRPSRARAGGRRRHAPRAVGTGQTAMEIAY